MDNEFFESVLVPQVMLFGFLGFQPTADGFRVDPHLPSDWPELTIDRIRWQDCTMRIRASKQAVDIWRDGGSGSPVFIIPPEGEWSVVLIAEDGKARSSVSPVTRASDGAMMIDWTGYSGVRFEKASK